MPRKTPSRFGAHTSQPNLNKAKADKDELRKIVYGGDMYAGHAVQKDQFDKLKPEELVIEATKRFGRIIGSSSPSVLKRRLRAYDKLAAEKSDEEADRVYKVPIPEVDAKDLPAMAKQLGISLSGKDEMDQRRIIAAMTDPEWLQQNPAIVARVVKQPEIKISDKEQRMKAMIESDMRGFSKCDAHSVYDPKIQEVYPEFVKEHRKQCEEQKGTRFGCYVDDTTGAYPFQCQPAMRAWLGGKAGAEGRVRKDQKSVTVLDDLAHDKELREVFDAMMMKGIEPAKQSKAQQTREAFMILFANSETAFLNFDKFTQMVLAQFFDKASLPLAKEKLGGDQAFATEIVRVSVQLWNEIVAPILRACTAFPKDFVSLLPSATRAAVDRFSAMPASQRAKAMQDYAMSTDTAKTIVDDLKKKVNETETDKITAEAVEVTFLSDKITVAAVEVAFLSIVHAIKTHTGSH